MTESNTTPSRFGQAIFQLYLAAVCSFSLIFGVISIGSLLTEAIDMLLPMPSYIETTQWDPESKMTVEKPADVIAREQAAEQARQSVQTQRDMSHSTVYLLISIVVFSFHWRLFKARKE